MPSTPMTADNVALVVNALAKGFPKRRVVNEEGYDVRMAEGWALINTRDEILGTSYFEYDLSKCPEGYKVEKVLIVS